MSFGMYKSTTLIDRVKLRVSEHCRIWKLSSITLLLEQLKRIITLKSKVKKLLLSKKSGDTLLISARSCSSLLKLLFA